MAWLRFILGPDFPTDQVGGSARLVLKNPHATGWVIVVALVLTGVSILLYRADRAAHPKPVRRYLAAAMRIAFFALLLTMILRPAVRFDLEGTVRRGLVLLFDDSASMKIADPRPADADRRRVAIATGAVDPAIGLNAPSPPPSTTQPSTDPIARLDLVKAGFRNDKLALIRKLAAEYDLRSAAFAQALAELPPVASHDALTGGGRASALGDALRDALARTRGQPLAGAVLVTDGASNTGVDPMVAAELAREQNVPLYVWGVGTTSPKDVIVTSIFAQDVAFLDDTVNVAARVRATGMSGRTAKLVLQLGEQTVASRDVTFSNVDGAEQVVDLTFTPKRAGEYKLSASIAPGGDEVVKDNNAQSQSIRVVDAKIKVLVVERQPRWEFKYLQALLLRDRRVSVKCVLTEADPAVAAAPGSPYLARFPASREELFAYDLIVLGDVDPRSFAAGQLESINEFVAKLGGGFMMIAGRSFAPAAYRGTAIEKLLPVELEGSGFRAQGPGTADEDADRPIRVELSAAGKRDPSMRLADTEVESALAWSKLPPLFWVAPGVTRGKPAADVLLTLADAPRGSFPSARDSKPPVIAFQQYGLGQSCYVGTDNTWRWRRNAGDRYHAALWGQMVQRLSLSHLLGESKRTQLRTDQRTYTAGQRVTVFGRLFDERYEPVTDAVVAGTYWPREAGTARVPITLRAVPEQPGLYRGEFPTPATPGEYVLALDRDPKSTIAITLSDPKIELAETAMNEPLLKQMAAATGGAFFREEDLYKLPDSIRLKTERIRSTVDAEIWSSPAWFAVMILLLGVEWVLRKMMQMK